MHILYAKDGLCIVGGPFNLVCLSHHHDIYLLVVKHEHLYLACVLLVRQGLAGCLAYGGFASCLVYYVIPYLLHLYEAWCQF